MGTAMGASYPAPVDPRTKPVIFWGAWLYFGPSAIGSLWIIGSTLYPVITGGSDEHHPESLAIAYPRRDAGRQWLFRKVKYHFFHQAARFLLTIFENR
jgi:hypothetical protein